MIQQNTQHRYLVLAPGEGMKYLGPRGFTDYSAWPERRAVDARNEAGGVVCYPRALSYAVCKQYDLVPVEAAERAHYEFERDAERVGFDPRRGLNQWSYGGRRLEEHYAELSEAELRSYPDDPMCFWALVLRGLETPAFQLDV